MALEALKRRLLTTLVGGIGQNRHTACPQLCCLRSFSGSTSTRAEEDDPEATLASEPSKTAGGTSSSEETKSSGQRGQKTGFTGDGFTEQRDFSEEDMEEYRKATHEAFYELSKIINEKEEEPKMSINLAGQGRAGWRNLWYDEGTLQQLWELDLTGGKVPDNEKNALLSPDSKLLMGVMYSKGSSIEEIATFFKVRQQRVMAILALQKLEERFEEAGEPMDDEYQQLMEGGWGCKGDGSDGNLGYFACDEVFGSGERHVRLLPKAPHYETKIGKDGKPVHRNLEELEEKVAKEEDKVMIEEFYDALLYNMGESGKSLKRNITRVHRPRRPKGGFSLVVKPSGKNQELYVAKPDGSRRELNEDEQVLQKRQRVRPRRKIL